MNKEEAYKWSIRQIRSKLSKNVDLVATLGNVCAILKERQPHFFWVGFYFTHERGLTLGPFQGPPACMVLAPDKGVCSAAFNGNKTLLVPDVTLFPGHIACDSRSRSEVVVVIRNPAGTPVGVLDVDAEALHGLDETDQIWLEKIADLISPLWA